jgi:hypothetical protein
MEDPVTLPPGCERLETTPAPTGSPTPVKTIGMVEVAFFAANAAGVLNVVIKSTFEPTSSAAKAPRRSSFPSAHRISRTISRPST